VGLRLSNCLSCLARSSEVMAHMFGPPEKKKKKKKTIEQPNRLKTCKNKARHLQNKSSASQETKLDLDTPSSYQFGKDVMKHRPASQMCKR